MSRRAHNPTDDFAGLVQRFFAEYLAAQRNLSPHTRLSYRNTFRLLLHFLAEQHRRSVDQLTLGALTPESILAFLDHLERTRRNSPRTRNVRLAAIRTFVRYVLGTAALEFLGPGQRILAIPFKKSSRAALGFMTREEINAVLAATDQNTWSGRRDLILFTLLYNTGARISEACNFARAIFTTTSFCSTARVARNARCRCGPKPRGAYDAGAPPTALRPNSSSSPIAGADRSATMASRAASIWR